MDSLRSRRLDSRSILPNLQSDVDQRDHHRQSARDLGNAGYILKSQRARDKRRIRAVLRASEYYTRASDFGVLRTFERPRATAQNGQELPVVSTTQRRWLRRAPLRLP